MKPDTEISGRELGAWLRLSRRRVDELAERGTLRKTGRGRFLLQESIGAYVGGRMPLEQLFASRKLKPPIFGRARRTSISPRLMLAAAGRMPMPSRQVSGSSWPITRSRLGSWRSIGCWIWRGLVEMPSVSLRRLAVLLSTFDERDQLWAVRFANKRRSSLKLAARDAAIVHVSVEFLAGLSMAAAAREIEAAALGLRSPASDGDKDLAVARKRPAIAETIRLLGVKFEEVPGRERIRQILQDHSVGNDFHAEITSGEAHLGCQQEEPQCSSI
jgi:hypothetical protein